MFSRVSWSTALFPTVSLNADGSGWCSSCLWARRSATLSSAMHRMSRGLLSTNASLSAKQGSSRRDTPESALFSSGKLFRWCQVTGCETRPPTPIEHVQTTVPAFARDSPQRGIVTCSSIGPHGSRREGNSTVRARNRRRGRIMSELRVGAEEFDP